jgi:hypothetical protein
MPYVYASTMDIAETEKKDFLRSMPDSIDAVILENAVTLNSADLEDIPVLQTNFCNKGSF